MKGFNDRRPRQPEERKLRRHGRGRSPSQYASAKLLGRSWNESSLEVAYNLGLDFDPLVKSYENQPYPLFWEELNQKGALVQRRYTMDFKVWYHDGREVYVEVKPHRKVSVDVLKRIGQARHAALKEGAEVILVTEKDIERGYLLENLKEISWYKKCTFDLDAWHQFAAALPDFIPFKELRSRLLASGLPEQWAFKAIWLRLGVFDLETELLNPSIQIEVIRS